MRSKCVCLRLKHCWIKVVLWCSGIFDILSLMWPFFGDGNIACFFLVLKRSTYVNKWNYAGPFYNCYECKSLSSAEVREGRGEERMHASVSWSQTVILSFNKDKIRGCKICWIDIFWYHIDFDLDFVFVCLIFFKWNWMAGHSTYPQKTTSLLCKEREGVFFHASFFPPSSFLLCSYFVPPPPLYVQGAQLLSRAFSFSPNLFGLHLMCTIHLTSVVKSSPFNIGLRFPPGCG